MSSLILKIGRFILLRIFLYLNIDFLNLNLLIFRIRFYGIILISLINFLNFDIKLIIAHSSLIYINIIIFILFSLFKLNLYIIFFILLFHRFNSIIIFFYIGLLYNYIKNRNYILIKGNIYLNNFYYLYLFIIIYFNLNRPLFIGFLREIFILIFIIKFLNYLLLIIFFIFILNLLYNFKYFIYLLFNFNLINFLNNLNLIKINIIFYFYFLFNILFLIKIDIYNIIY